MHLLQASLLRYPACHLRPAPHPPARWWPAQRLSKLRRPLLVEQRPLPCTRIAVPTVTETPDAPLVVAVDYPAYPTAAVAGDLAHLPGTPALAEKPHDLMMRAFHGIFGLPVAVLQLFCACMRRQL